MKPMPAGRTAYLLLALLVGSSVRAEDAPARAAAPVATALNLDPTAIRGNQELPKVMYVVPWKDAAMAELAGRPVNSLVEEVLAPVDREVFRRQTRYFHQLHDAESLRPAN